MLNPRLPDHSAHSAHLDHSSKISTSSPLKPTEIPKPRIKQEARVVPPPTSTIQLREPLSKIRQPGFLASKPKKPGQIASKILETPQSPSTSPVVTQTKTPVVTQTKTRLDFFNEQQVGSRKYNQESVKLRDLVVDSLMQDIGYTYNRKKKKLQLDEKGIEVQKILRTYVNNTINRLPGLITGNQVITQDVLIQTFIDEYKKNKNIQGVVFPEQIHSAVPSALQKFNARG